MINIYFAIEAIENDDERDLVMKLYKQYSKKVSAIAYKILANKEDVEDALGNTFLRIIKYRDKFMDIDDIETNRLIVIITRSVCFDMLDERKKNGFLQAALGYKSDENETNYQEPIADTNVELDYLDKEMIVMIKQQINKLKTPAKEIIIYKYFYDMKNTEIAELLGINASTVGTILSRNIKRIRDMLNEEKFGTKSISEK